MMSHERWRERLKACGLTLFLLGPMLIDQGADASVTYRVRMNTAAWSGLPGYVVVSMTSGVQDELSQNQSVTVCNVNGNAVRGQTLTTGGGWGGDLIYALGTATAPCTELAPKVTTSLLFDREVFFYSHLGINMSLRANASMQVPKFRDSLVFDVVLPTPAAVRGSFEDQVAVHVLKADGEPAFPTGDALGSDAICAFTAPKVSNGSWTAEHFSPATYTSAQAQVPATITIQFPPPPPPPAVVQPATSLAITTGRFSAALSWVEPGQAGGDADSYDIRYLMNGTLSEANWDGPGVEQVWGEPPPGAADTQHCIEIDSLSSCKTYSFGIRTWDNGAPSTLSVINGNTACSGYTMAFCDGGGLMTGGGGGGGEETSATDLAAASWEIQAAGAPDENSLLWWDGSGLEITDLQRLRSGVRSAESYPVTVWEIERRRTELDQIRLGAVDHAPDRVALAGIGHVIVGTAGPAPTVRGLEGAVRPSVEAPHHARSGEVFEVDLGPSRTNRALVLETRRPLAGARTDSLGIRVERHLVDGSWSLAAVVHPRREFDRIAIPAQGSPTMRVTFFGSYPLRAIETLEDVEIVAPTALSLSDASHSRLGTVSPAVRDSGDTKTTIVPGDSLALSFAATEIPSGMVRTLFLTAKGSYERLDGEGAPGAEAERAVANEPILEFSLGAAFPNPSDGTVTIAYTLARQVPTVLRVYNVAGREVRTLVDQELAAGRRQALWDGRDNGGRKVSSGVYFYRLRAGSWESERKLIVIQ